MFNDIVYAMVLQSDGIHMPIGGIRNPWRGIAEAFFWRSLLIAMPPSKERSSAVQTPAKAEASAGWNDGVFLMKVQAVQHADPLQHHLSYGKDRPVFAYAQRFFIPVFHDTAHAMPRCRMPFCSLTIYSLGTMHSLLSASALVPHASTKSLDT